VAVATSRVEPRNIPQFHRS